MTNSNSNNNNCQFHQQGNYIHVLIKGNNLTEDDLDVQIQRRRLTVTIMGQTMMEGLLHSPVDVGNSRVKVHPDHVEIKLRKDNAEEVWPQLMLGIPDMMTSMQLDMTTPKRTSLQRAQEQQQPVRVSPEQSPTRTNKPMSSLNASLNASLSNMFNTVVATVKDEMRDDSVVFSA